IPITSQLLLPFLFNDTATTEIYTLSLHDALPISDSGFAGLAKYTAAELRKILSDRGVTCVSAHFGIGELRKDQPGRIAWAKEMGLTQMLVPSLDGPKNPTLDDVKRAADEYNQMGERAAAAGISQG